jgi:hypothetical protein
MTRLRGIIVYELCDIEEFRRGIAHDSFWKEHKHSFSLAGMERPFLRKVNIEASVLKMHLF